MISIVIPFYNEADQVYSNIVKILKILKDHRIKYEILLIDDGSTDTTWQEMKRLAKSYNHILLIKLSRNFGKEAALCAGLEHATGNACIILDGDLQHPPELIPEMVRLWQDEGFEVVEGVKSNRGKETFLSRIMAFSFYKLFNRITGINLDMASDFKLLDYKVVNAWKELKEVNIFFRGMTAWLGYKRTQIPFEVQERMNGSSKWSFINLVKLAFKSITAFSSVPLYITTWLGGILLIIVLILVTQTLFMKFSGQALNGFTTVIILQLGIGSFIMISLGTMGLYISKIYEEVKKRPRYLVSETDGIQTAYSKKHTKTKKQKMDQNYA